MPLLRVRALLVLTLVLSAPAAASLAAAPADPAAAKLDPALAPLLAAGAPVSIIVRFESLDALHAYAPRIAERPALAFRTLPGLAFTATPDEVRELAASPRVAYVEHDAPLPVHLPTATIASRAREVWGGAGAPTLDPLTGAPIDGRGVGVAVIDTGVDATHPALAHSVVRNYALVPGKPGKLVLAGQDVYEMVFSRFPFMHMQDTDVAGGHGTHVAGIVAANASGFPRGAAPGASLYAFDAGAGSTLTSSSIAAAWEWILQNHDDVEPRIRVVTNSYGPITEGGSGGAVSQLAHHALDAGLVVVFSAGNGDILNDGGDGSDDRVNAYSKSPHPGILGVANYDDGDTGTRDGGLAPSSSRGLATDPATWPDVSAPGVDILSTMARTDARSAPSLALGVAGALPATELVNQWHARVAFRFGDTTSRTGELDFVLHTKPALVYHAHTDTYAYGEAGRFLPSDPLAAVAARHYADIPQGAGPVRPLHEASRLVQPGDLVEFNKTLGVTQNGALRIVAPDGRTADVVVPFGCHRACAVSIDLHAHFPGAPADGTWTLAPSRAASTALSPPMFATEMTGTSMAAPHVAGVIALMLQANPALTPAQVELILEDTAYEFTFGAAYEPDPYHVGGMSSYDKGHGLVDAHAAVSAALALR